MQYQQQQLLKELKRMELGFAGSKMDDKLAQYQAQEQIIKKELKRQA